MRQYTLWLLHLLFLYGAYAGIVGSLALEGACGFSKICTHTSTCTVCTVSTKRNKYCGWPLQYINKHSRCLSMLIGTMSVFLCQSAFHVLPIPIEYIMYVHIYTVARNEETAIILPSLPPLTHRLESLDSKIRIFHSRRDAAASRTSDRDSPFIPMAAEIPASRGAGPRSLLRPDQEDNLLLNTPLSSPPDSSSLEDCSKVHGPSLNRGGCVCVCVCVVQCCVCIGVFECQFVCLCSMCECVCVCV